MFALFGFGFGFGLIRSSRSVCLLFILLVLISFVCLVSACRTSFLSHSHRLSQGQQSSVARDGSDDTLEASVEGGKDLTATAGPGTGTGTSSSHSSAANLVALATMSLDPTDPATGETEGQTAPALSVSAKTPSGSSWASMVAANAAAAEVVQSGTPSPRPTPVRKEGSSSPGAGKETKVKAAFPTGPGAVVSSSSSKKVPVAGPAPTPMDRRRDGREGDRRSPRVGERDGKGRISGPGAGAEGRGDGRPGRDGKVRHTHHPPLSHTCYTYTCVHTHNHICIVHIPGTYDCCCVFPISLPHVCVKFACTRIGTLVPVRVLVFVPI
jgi:hypothetical protein